MDMNIEIIPITKEQKSVLRQLLELYEYDFTEFEAQDVDEHGFYGYYYLDHYWTDETRHPFFIVVDGKYAGFVLVNRHCVYAADEANAIAEFFVMRRYKRMGVGSYAAKRVFGMFKVKWEVRVLNSNKPALVFWRKVISEYTSGEFEYHPEPTEDWSGVGYVFKSK
jgi:predicted acetyltransferase